MGRVKIVLVKKTAERLLAEYPGKFTTDFEANKKVVDELLDVHSKKLRNLVTGHVTRLVVQRGGEAPEAEATSENAEPAISETPSGESVRSPIPA